MTRFVSEGLTHHYEVHGSGRPVVMLHGAGVTFTGNFGVCGWIDRFNDHGFQVIGLDMRGHGESDPPHDPSASGIEPLARDVVALLDHLAVERAAVVGYSIGSAIALHVLHTYPERVRAGALVAAGDGLIGVPPMRFDEMMPGLVDILVRHEYPADLPPHQAMYWTFSTQVAGGRDGVAMMARGDFPPCTPGEAGAIEVPVLVVSGENDPVLGTGARLAESLPKGRYVEIAGGDHFSLAVDESVQNTVAEFLAAD